MASAAGTSRFTSNKNFLSPVGFRMLINKTPNVEYFCNSVTLPTISINEAPQMNPNAVVPWPGDRVTYDTLSVRFLVDEDMNNYLEIHNWIIGLGRPYSPSQYSEQNDSGIFSDATVMILTSNNNANIKFMFQDMFPMSLSPLDFRAGAADIEYLEAEVSFRYKIFTIEQL